ncbi:MAG: NUDIX hydrolase [archaeon]
MLIEEPEKIDKHTVGIILTYKGKYLLTHRTLDALWGSVAGWIEEGETPEQAIIREIKEELGIDLEPEFFTTTYHNYDGKAIAYHIFTFDFKEDPSEKIALNDELALGFKFISLEEALKLDLFEDEDYVKTLHHKRKQAENI